MAILVEKAEEERKGRREREKRMLAWTTARLEMMGNKTGPLVLLICLSSEMTVAFLYLAGPGVSDHVKAVVYCINMYVLRTNTRITRPSFHRLWPREMLQ